MICLMQNQKENTFILIYCVVMSYKQLMNLTEQLVDVNKQLEDIKRSQKESSVFNLDVEKLTNSQRDHLQKKLNEVRRKKRKYNLDL